MCHFWVVFMLEGEQQRRHLTRAVLPAERDYIPLEDGLIVRVFNRVIGDEITLRCGVMIEDDVHLVTDWMNKT